MSSANLLLGSWVGELLLGQLDEVGPDGQSRWLRDLSEDWSDGLGYERPDLDGTPSRDLGSDGLIDGGGQSTGGGDSYPAEPSETETPREANSSSAGSNSETADEPARTEGADSGTEEPPAEPESQLRRFDGGPLSNVIRGSDGDDLIDGGFGNDWIGGGLGDDVLHGGPGFDILTGGPGADHFSFELFLRDGATASSFGDAPDQIADFDPSADFIDFKASDLGIGFAAGPLPTASFVNGTAATAATGQFLYSIDQNGDGLLRWDADGTGAGAPIDVALLLGGPALTAADILLV